jgi:hypothetical protein
MIRGRACCRPPCRRLQARRADPPKLATYAPHQQAGQAKADRHSRHARRRPDLAWQPRLQQPFPHMFGIRQLAIMKRF